MPQDNSKALFLPSVFVVEFLLVLVLLSIGSDFFYLFIPMKVITTTAVVEKVEGGGKSTSIYLMNQDQKLILHGPVRDLCDYHKFKALKKGAVITFSHPSTKLGSCFLNYLSGNIEIVALSSEKYGTIFSLKNYLSFRNSMPRIILLVVGSVPMLILAFALIFSWFLALLMVWNPKKWENLEHHLLIQHKIQRELP